MLPPETEEQISAYADGVLSGDEEKQTARLIETIPEAKAFYQSILQMRKQFSHFPAFSLESDFSQNILRRIEEKNNAPAPVRLAKKEIFQRLTQARIWIYPISALVVVFLIIPLFSVTRSEKNVAQNVVPIPTVQETIPVSEGDAKGDTAEETILEESAPSDRIPLRSAPMPLAEGSAALPHYPVQTVRITASPENIDRLNLHLQKIAAETQITSIQERRNDTAFLLEMVVTEEQKNHLLEKIQSLEFISAETVSGLNETDSDAGRKDQPQAILLRWEIVIDQN